MSYKQTVIDAILQTEQDEGKRAILAEFIDIMDTRSLNQFAAGRGVTVAAPLCEASVVQYTRQTGKKDVGTYLVINVAGAKNAMFRLCDGDKLTPDGSAKLVAVANAVADLLEG
jgi:hypothetical protein